MDQDLILTKTINNVRHIQLNRIKYKNALTLDMYQVLTQSLIDAEKDEQINVIMLTGSEEVFCAGNDLNDFIAHPPTSANSPAFKFLLTLNRLKKPIIAGVSGPAIGIGTTMLLHFDFVVASTNAIFKLPFVNLGLTPEGASSLILPRLMGQRKSAELLMLGTSFNAHQAKDFSIINQTCDEGDCLTVTLNFANKLANQPPAAIQSTKHIMKAHLVDQIERTILAEGELFSQKVTSEEAKTAINAFLQK